MNNIDIACPHCGEIFRKKGLHHHIKRKHEGRPAYYTKGFKIDWTEERRKTFGNTVRELKKNNPQRHSDETKKKLSEIGLNSKHRRLVKSTRKYRHKDGYDVLLDSSWEEILAKRLDEQNIKWSRPKPLSWIDKNQKHHNYFPDFYLEEYSIFLDPKNPYAYINQKEKIEALTRQHKNIIFLTKLEEIKEFDISNYLPALAQDF